MGIRSLFDIFDAQKRHDIDVFLILTWMIKNFEKRTIIQRKATMENFISMVVSTIRKVKWALEDDQGKIM